MRLRILVALIVGLAAWPAAAQATYPGDNGKLLFVEAPSPGSFGFQIATVNADGTGHQILAEGTEPAWSPSGDRIAFVDSRGAVTVMNADGTGRRRVAQSHSSTQNTGNDPAWSPDGQQLALVWTRSSSCGSIVITNVDGSETREPFPADSRCFAMEDLEWSPSGNTLAFSAATGSAAEIFTIESDGTALTQVTDEALPATDPEWSPDGERILYDAAQEDLFGLQNVISIKADGTDRTFIAEGRDPVWSPDRGEIAFLVRDGNTGNWRIEAKRTNHDSSRQIIQSPPVKDSLDWQRLAAGPSGYPRPKAASPVDVSLVPTYYQCLEPNREHGPPLSFPSCNPPVPGSNHVTVGTVDANGHPSAFRGRLTYLTLVGNPGTTADEADVQLTASLSDVRCRTAGVPCTDGALSDYTGQLMARFVVRITDKLNALGHSITVEDVPFTAIIPCSVTPSSMAGSDCGTATTLEAIVPGVVPEGKRSNWQLNQVVVYDRGPNGDGTNGPPTPFAVAGVFVP